MADRMAGQVLNGRYEIQGVLGGGGMALVYRARDRVLNRTVAIKVLREQYASDPQFLQRFTREAQAAGALSHPNIVSVYDVGQEGNLPYIVMEYVPGITLRDLIARDGPLPVAQAVEIAAQILAALDYAHRNGLVHRDIKPGNVLITPQGTVKVVDFGIAKSVSDLSLTGAGMALGTAAYFSPEQARGETARPQSDIYSVGVTLYEMLTGRPPFQADNDVAMAYKHINEAPLPPRQLNPAIPPLLERIVLRALAKNPTARFQSAGEMEQALRNYAAFGAQATAAVPVAPVVTPPPVTRPVPRTTTAPRVPPPLPPVPSYVQSYRGRPPWIIWALGLVALLILLAGAVFALASGGLFSAATPTPDLGGQPTFVPATFVPTVLPSPTALPPSATPPPSATAPPTDTPPPTNTAVPQITVPDLTSHSLRDAQAIAEAVGLKIQVVRQDNDPNHPAGTVITQDPQSGTLVPAGTTVNLVVSKGPPVLAMPNVINTDGAQAQQYLSGLGFKVVVEEEQSQSVPKGVVSRQAPDPGTQVQVGDTVTIGVSTGPPPTATAEPPPPATPTTAEPPTAVPETAVPVTAVPETPPPAAARVPDVIGIDQQHAIATVSLLGLNPQVQRVRRDQVPGINRNLHPGQVVATQPEVGTEVTLGSTVILSVLQ